MWISRLRCVVRVLLSIFLLSWTLPARAQPNRGLERSEALGVRINGRRGTERARRPSAVGGEKLSILESARSE